MSEKENMRLLMPDREVTVADVRALTGAVTPHFSLQVRNRVRRLIEPLPADHPARIEGERKIAELERISRNTGERRGAEMTDTLAHPEPAP